jgi:hypothetical protein
MMPYVLGGMVAAGVLVTGRWLWQIKDALGQRRTDPW